MSAAGRLCRWWLWVRGRVCRTNRLRATSDLGGDGHWTRGGVCVANRPSRTGLGGIGCGQGPSWVCGGDGKAPRCADGAGVMSCHRRWRNSYASTVADWKLISTKVILHYTSLTPIPCCKYAHPPSSLPSFSPQRQSTAGEGHLCTARSASTTMNCKISGTIH